MNFRYQEGEGVSELWTNEEEYSFATSDIWNGKNQVILLTQNVMERNDYCKDYVPYGFFSVWYVNKRCNQFVV